jgi:hypothetical protein
MLIFLDMGLAGELRSAGFALSGVIEKKPPAGGFFFEALVLATALCRS